MFKKSQSEGQFDSSYDQNTGNMLQKDNTPSLFSFRNVFSVCSVPEWSVLPVSTITSPRGANMTVHSLVLWGSIPRADAATALVTAENPAKQDQGHVTTHG